MKLLPRLYWRRLTPQEAFDLGCEVRWAWEVLEFEWLAFGFTFYARPIV